MLPRLVLRVRKAFKRLPMAMGQPAETEGPEISAEWRNMLETIEAEAAATERRLARAESALNRLSLS